MQTKIESNKTLINRREIAGAVTELAASIKADYSDCAALTIICVLKGAFIFVADLIRELEIPIEVEFVRISTYGDSQSPMREPSIEGSLDFEISGRDILIVEDIIDSGKTVIFLTRLIEAEGPKSISVAALIDKTGRRTEPVEPDYSCFQIEEGFVYGYGLDRSGRDRNAPDIMIDINEA